MSASINPDTPNSALDTIHDEGRPRALEEAKAEKAVDE